MSVAVDIAEGIKTQWNATGSLTSVIPLASVYFGDVPGRPNPPYANIEITRWQEPTYTAPCKSGSSFVAYQTAKVNVFNTTPIAVETGLDAVLAAFKAEFTIPNSTTLEWWYDDDACNRTPTFHDASEMYEGSISFNTALQRTLP